MPTNLLELPYEVRDLIFEYCILSEDRTIRPCCLKKLSCSGDRPRIWYRHWRPDRREADNRRFRSWQKRCEWASKPSLMLVCRSLYEQVSKLFYSRQVISISDQRFRFASHRVYVTITHEMLTEVDGVEYCQTCYNLKAWKMAHKSHSPGEARPPKCWNALRGFRHRLTVSQCQYTHLTDWIGLIGSNHAANLRHFRFVFIGDEFTTYQESIAENLDETRLWGSRPEGGRNATFFEAGLRALIRHCDIRKIQIEFNHDCPWYCYEEPHPDQMNIMAAQNFCHLFAPESRLRAAFADFKQLSLFEIVGESGEDFPEYLADLYNANGFEDGFGDAFKSYQHLKNGLGLPMDGELITKSEEAMLVRKENPRELYVWPSW